MENKKGALYLIPVPLGEHSRPHEILTPDALALIHQLNEFVVENEKSARHFLKATGTPFPLSEIKLYSIGKHASQGDMRTYLDAAKNGKNMGLLSDAGCPGIADPGAQIVQMAHEANIRVIPLIGPSSLVLALMASGMNGQNFRFHGYLPIDKNERTRYLKNIERETKQYGTTQLFIETPFRNNQLFDDLLKTLDPSTRFGIACDLTLPSQYIFTGTAAEWKKKNKPDFHKRPAVFLIGQ
jgi:16S rRNA (cytidine1402-2'-O)-methyltransferase